jgi:hypothetical protein
MINSRRVRWAEHPVCIEYPYIRQIQGFDLKNEHFSAVQIILHTARTKAK